MVDRSVARLAWTLWGLVIVLAAASLVLRLWNGSAMGSSVEGAERLSEFLWWVVLIPALVPAYATVGAVVASRRPRNPVGWLCLAFGVLVAAEDATWQYGSRALEIDPGLLPAGVPVALAAQALVAVMPVPFTLMLLLFPDGRFLSRLWRFVALIAVAGACLEALVVLFTPTFYAGLHTEVPNPIGITGLDAVAEAASNVGTAVGLLVLLAAVISVFLRWRRSGGSERQQLKWLAYIGAVIALALLCGVASAYALGVSYPTVLILTVGIAGITLGIPVAVGVAMLRHRLYDVDVLINRTLVYGALTATLVLVYFGGVVALQYAFRALTGQESQLAVVVSTLAIAALFVPLRQRIQAFIDRRFYRRKYDAAKTLAQFSTKLRDETDLELLAPELLRVIEETVQPAHASLWLREPGGKESR